MGIKCLFKPTKKLCDEISLFEIEDHSFYYRNATERYDNLSDVEKEHLPRDRTIYGYKLEEMSKHFLVKRFNLNPSYITPSSSLEDKNGIDYYVLGIPFDPKSSAFEMVKENCSYRNKHVNFSYKNSRGEITARIDKATSRIIVVCNYVKEDDVFIVFGFHESNFLDTLLLHGNGKTKLGLNTWYCSMENLCDSPFEALVRGNQYHLEEERFLNDLVEHQLEQIEEKNKKISSLEEEIRLLKLSNNQRELILQNV